MKIRIIKFLKRVGYVFICFPVLMVILLIGISLALPYWILTGKNIEDSKANGLVQDFHDYFD